MRFSPPFVKALIVVLTTLVTAPAHAAPTAPIPPNYLDYSTRDDLELERRGLDIAYVRTPEGREVDFLVRGGGGAEELIQVTADASDRATSERELSALDEAAGLYPKATRRLLTMTLDTVPAQVPPGVVAQPAYDWLLELPGRN